MLSPLEKSILSTLVYFDIFEYPLTILEIHRYLLFLANDSQEKFSIREIRDALFSSPRLEKIVRFKNGFFYLRGRENNLKTRNERQVWAVKKYHRAQIVAKFFSYIPFVRLVGVCNSLAYNNARDESDIDLFVVTKSSGVWWARWFMLLILKFLYLRPGQGGVRNKICLSFFVDERHLNLELLQSEQPDVYLALWLATFYPLYDHSNWLGRLWQQNQWLKKYLSQTRPVTPSHERYFRSPCILKYPWEWLLQPITFLIAWIQVWLLPETIKKMVNVDTRVRIESGILKFHTNDRRLEFNREFSTRLARFVSSSYQQ